MSRLMDLIFADDVVPPPLVRQRDPVASLAKWQDLNSQLRRLLARCPHIVADNVAEFCALDHAKEPWSLEADFPNLAPPFSEFWIEWRWPPTMNEGSHRVDLPVGASRLYGALVIGAQYGDEGAMADVRAMAPPEFWPPLASARWALAAGLYAYRERLGRVEGPLVTVYLHVAPDGRVVPPVAWTNRIKDSSEVGGHPAPTLFVPALLAICFMHCRNVHREAAAAAVRLDRARQRRNRRPLLRYETLIIDPMKAVLQREGKSQAVGLRRALHICRGHFADYTKGAGLFGKHHGVYWIDSHVRGTRAAGRVEKEYDVRALRSPEER